MHGGKTSATTKSQDPAGKCRISKEDFYQLYTILRPYFQKRQTGLGRFKLCHLYFILLTKCAIGKLQRLLNYNYKVLAIIKRVSYTIQKQPLADVLQNRCSQ